MEAKLWRVLYRALMGLAHARRKRQQFDDRWIVLVWLWAVLHDRPACWACDPGNWPPGHDRPLPSPSTLSRRLRTLGVLQLLERLGLLLSDALGPVPLVKSQDSKPLLVGAYSKDREAKRGRLAAGMTARGYRVHALCHGHCVRHWTLSTMKDHDALVAPRLLERLEGAGYVVGDNAYDANALHRLSEQKGHQMIAPARRACRQVRDTRHNCPQRLRSLDVMHSPLKRFQSPSDFGRKLYDCRERVESCFGQLTLMGLHYLPAWVRGPRRVALWVGGKIILHLCRCIIRQRLKT